MSKLREGKGAIQFLNNYSHYWVKANPNGIGGSCGSLLEPVIADVFGWKQEDGTGYDFITEEKRGYQVSGVPQLSRDITCGKQIKIELKHWNDSTKSNIIDVGESKKDGNDYIFDYLAIVVIEFNNFRFSLIHKQQIVDMKSSSLSLNLNPGLKHNHTIPVYSEFTTLFLDNEVNGVNEMILNKLI
tara:strand:+ start:411 stop:968 length:558 start_codon:yes stop_codon:yes gene_type:complete